MKSWAKQFYKSSKWLKLRKLVLIRDNYLCVRCGAPALIVHHIVHLTQSNITDADVSLNMSNLESVCLDCHNKIHEVTVSKSTKSGFYFDKNGELQQV